MAIHIDKPMPITAHEALETACAYGQTNVEIIYVHKKFKYRAKVYGKTFHNKDFVQLVAEMCEFILSVNEAK